MDYGILPPEVNSGRMYAGPGAESMLASKAAWEALAAQLRSTADSYSAVISAMTANWRGPSSEAMSAAVGQYVEWLSDTAVQAELSAEQAGAAAAAYETAYAATVPPMVIEVNRAELAALVATNVLGQNMPAIAATEARYADMWAQDASAMYSYAGQSAAATRLNPFAPPPQTTDASAAQSTAASTQTASMTAIPSSLQSLAAPAQSSSLSSWESILLRDVVNPFGSLSPIEKGLEFYEFPASASLPSRNALVSSTLGYSLLTRGFSTGQVPVPILPGVPYPPVASAPVAVSTVSAELGRAGTAGALSVPPSWAAATPEVRLAAAVLQGTSAGSAPLAVADYGGLLGRMGLAAAAGGAVGAAATRNSMKKDAAPKCPDSADDEDGQRGDQEEDKEKGDKTSEKLTRVLAELSAEPESVQHWHTDKANLESLLAQLSGKPGVHAVHVAARHAPTPNPTQPRWGGA
ncbi:PPE family protein [Mycobacterium vicinigordonae]|uniref:PPE family protein n=1 Tax=Mycobacterium vicinigordonae TaxID=1719132 RepID=A0A7D6I0Q6_9MYCO|nr:PPE family protein [Mycobacterium vicinigordonae]QLL07314.1 PPE family protein [Mycobacterium vicinigordonae]